VTQNDDDKRRYKEHKRQTLADWKYDADEIEADNNKLLHREAKRIALTRIEESARTEAQFKEVQIIWDRLDKNHAERVSYHEKLCKNDTLSWEMFEYDVIIPRPIDRAYSYMEMKGEFLDTIYDCPHDIHETTSCKSLYDVTEELDEPHKELLYYRAIRYWSPQQIAKMRGQTDRNIRKVYSKMLEGIHYELFYYLYGRYKKRLPITTSEKALVIAGIKKYHEGELNEEDISADESNGV
jgi:hypothetical protein